MSIRAPRSFDLKKDSNYKNRRNRKELNLDLTKSPDHDKTVSFLLPLDVECFEVAKHLRIKASTIFDEAKEKFKYYFANTETPEELRERYYLRRRAAGESINSNARDVLY